MHLRARCTSYLPPNLPPSPLPTSTCQPAPPSCLLAPTCPSELGLDKAGVTVNPNGKISTRHDATSKAHVYALGDVVDGSTLDPPAAETELTPVAVRAGKLLAARLYGGATEQMDYTQVPTTVYTPLEYGACGLSESSAVERFGAEQVARG